MEGGSGQNHDNIDYTNIAIPVMVPSAPKNEHQESSSSPNWQNLLKKPQEEFHALIKTKKLRLAAWRLSHNNWQQR